MHPFSSEEILRAWELGFDQHPIDRALKILSLAMPEEDIDKLARLTIGQRDALLLAQRVITFGQSMGIYTQCPKCGARLDIPVRGDDISRAGEKEEKFSGTLSSGSFRVSFRLPDSLDLAAALKSADISSARSSMIERCITNATMDGLPVDVGQIPEDMVSQIMDQMAQGDPQADVLLDVQCPECGETWQIIFDILFFLWREICAEAKRILIDVHTLARAYGWSERDILAMSPLRRQSYLEMVWS